MVQCLLVYVEQSLPQALSMAPQLRHRLALHRNPGSCRFQVTRVWSRVEVWSGRCRSLAGPKPGARDPLGPVSHVPWVAISAYIRSSGVNPLTFSGRVDSRIPSMESQLQLFHCSPASPHYRNRCPKGTDGLNLQAAPPVSWWRKC